MLRDVADLRDANGSEPRAGFACAEAMVRRAAQDHASALASALRAVALRSELGVTNRLIKQSLVEAFEAALALGDLDQARSLLGLVESLPKGELTPYLRAHAARFRARLGSVDDAELTDISALFEAAIDHFRASGFAFWLAVTRVEYAEWLAANDQAADAGALREQAAEFFTHVEAQPWLERLAASEHATAGSAQPLTASQPR